MLSGKYSSLAEAFANSNKIGKLETTTGDDGADEGTLVVQVSWWCSAQHPWACLPCACAVCSAQCAECAS